MVNQGSSYPYSLDTFQQINYWKSQPLKKDRSKSKKRISQKIVKKIMNNDW